MKAIDLNNVSVEENKKAFNYGRLAAHDPEKLEALMKEVAGGVLEEPVAQTFDDIVGKRIKYLTDYQDAAYADRYRLAVERFREVDPELAEVVAKNYHKLLAYKDEYEVARLYTNGEFIRKLKAQFEGDYKLKFNLAPPIMEKTDPATGRPKKREFGPWMMTGFHVLARFKFLRGTKFDIFGYHHDRKAERALIADYEATMDLVLSKLNTGNRAVCLELLNLPDMIRGFGPVKEGNIRKAKGQKQALLVKLSSAANSDSPAKVAA